MKNILLLVVLTIFSLSIKAQSEPQAIHVEVTGKGAPIIFIPGFTVPGSIWNPVVKELEKNYECHVVTLAGFGGTESIEFPWLPKVNQSLVKYFTDNKLQNITIIGHSLGGTVATWLASRTNSEVSEIILVDTLPAAGALMMPDFNPDNLVYDNSYSNQQLSMDEEQFKQMATMMAQGMSVNQSAQEDIKNWIMMADRKTYVYGYTDYLKLDLREDLKKIEMPVTIIAATQPYGKEMVKQTYENQYLNLKDYDFIMADDAAHFIMLDKPEWFMEQIKIILSSK